MGKRLLSSILFLSLSAGCAAKMGDLALGKVVVYRNGIAYFERFANVKNGEVSLLLAESKVNDLLKSLKVEDAKTGELLPVSFPARKGSDGLVQMRVKVPGKEDRRVKLSYVSESPAWKPSYRISLDREGEVQLQGWAIVDNVSGEDWKKVTIGVGSTSALSFRYDLWSVRDVHRQTLGHKERLAKAPPTATGLLPTKTSGATPGANAKETIVLDSTYTKNIPIPGRTFESTLQSAAGSQDDGLGVSFSGSTSLENQYVIDGVNTTGFSRGKGRSSAEIAEERKRKEAYLQRQQLARAEAQRMKRKNDELAEQLIGSEGHYTIEGVAAPAEIGSQARALSMANELRNELINRGVAPKRLSVQTRVGAVGQPTTLEVAATDVQDGTEQDSSTELKGESKFVSKTPVSIPHQGSSMVSVVNQPTKGKVVYLYDAMSKHGNKDFAFKAIRFENPTGQHLEGGPITVFGDNTFVGEGLADAIAPGASTILPYALDQQVHVEKTSSFSDTVVGFKRVVADGAIVAKQRLSTVRFTIHNRSHEATTVYIRHDSNQGWQLKKGPKNIEKLGRLSVFPVKMAAGARKSVELVEFTPITSTIDLTTDQGVAALAKYLQEKGKDSPFAKAASELVAAHASISKKLREIDVAAGQLALYRGRLDELHGQLVTLELVSSKGRLLRNIQNRMGNMSDRVQETVMRVVELREQIMLERFAYQDLVGSMALLTES